jgi:hypothetical protein
MLDAQLEKTLKKIVPSKIAPPCKKMKFNHFQIECHFANSIANNDFRVTQPILKCFILKCLFLKNFHSNACVSKSSIFLYI